MGHFFPQFTNKSYDQLPIVFTFVREIALFSINALKNAPALKRDFLWCSVSENPPVFHSSCVSQL